MTPPHSNQAVGSTGKKTSSRQIIPVFPLARVKKTELVKGEYVLLLNVVQIILTPLCLPMTYQYNISKQVIQSNS